MLCYIRTLSDFTRNFLKCERSELVNISQLFHSFSQTRLLTVEFSQAKPKLDWKTSKMTRQFCREKQGKIGHIFGKIRHCAMTTKILQKNQGLLFLKTEHWNPIKGINIRYLGGIRYITTNSKPQPIKLTKVTLHQSYNTMSVSHDSWFSSFQVSWTHDSGSKFLFGPF